MPATLSRQIATGAATFFLTGTLILANAPDRPEQSLRLQRAAASTQVLTVFLTRHG